MIHAMWPVVAAGSGRIIATIRYRGKTLLPHLYLVSSFPTIVLPLWIIQRFKQHIDKRDFHQALSNAASPTPDFNSHSQGSINLLLGKVALICKEMLTRRLYH